MSETFICSRCSAKPSAWVGREGWLCANHFAAYMARWFR